MTPPVAPDSGESIGRIGPPGGEVKPPGSVDIDVDLQVFEGLYG